MLTHSCQYQPWIRKWIRSYIGHIFLEGSGVKVIIIRTDWRHLMYVGADSRHQGRWLLGLSWHQEPSCWRFSLSSTESCWLWRSWQPTDGAEPEPGEMDQSHINLHKSDGVGQASLLLLLTRLDLHQRCQQEEKGGGVVVEDIPPTL